MMKHGFFMFIITLSVAHMMTSNNRQLRQQHNAPVQTQPYRATYIADFQQLVDSHCFMGDPPTLIVTCYGTEMTILGTSDASIQCRQMVVPLVENGISYECINTCTPDTIPPCTSVYLASDDMLIGPFGSIYFMCEGSMYDHVDAVYTYIGGTTNGTCVTSTTTIEQQQSRNFHKSRMGILCPAVNDYNFIYDNTYFTCYSDSTDNPENDTAVCSSGQNCLDQECDIIFSDITIHTNIIQINQCVETPDKSLPPTTLSTTPITSNTLVPTIAPSNSVLQLSTPNLEESWTKFRKNCRKNKGYLMIGAIVIAIIFAYNILGRKHCIGGLILIAIEGMIAWLMLG